MSMKRKQYKTDDQLKDLALILHRENSKRTMLDYYYQMKRNILGGQISGFMTEKKARRLFGMEVAE